MKAKVTLTHTVTMVVEGSSEETISDWLTRSTPAEALQQVKEQTGKYAEESYDEEIECFVRDDSAVDFVIKEDYE